MDKIAMHGGRFGKRWHFYGFDRWHGFWPRRSGVFGYPYRIYQWAWFEIHLQDKP